MFQKIIGYQLKEGYNKTVGKGRRCGEEVAPFCNQKGNGKGKGGD